MEEKTEEQKIQEVEDKLDGEGFLTDRDYYSIKWPIVNREWTFGVYVNTILDQYGVGGRED